MGLTLHMSNGGELKGPITNPLDNSASSNSSTIEAWLPADKRFLHLKDSIGSVIKPVWNPTENPSNRNCLKAEDGWPSKYTPSMDILTWLSYKELKSLTRQEHLRWALKQLEKTALVVVAPGMVKLVVHLSLTQITDGPANKVLWGTHWPLVCWSLTDQRAQI